MAQSGFDRHRFDNYSAWLDREGRLKAKAEGRLLGHGYAEPRPPPPAKEERPFYVLEPAFTSGIMVNRKYEMVDPVFKCETERSDPYHYPNHMEVRESQHFQDGRRRSQNVDPREWKPNPAFAEVVTDDMVKMQLSAHLGEARSYTDPKMMNALFDEGIRPQAHTLSELNCDVSCIDLPAREGGLISSRAKPSAAPRAPAGRAAAKRATPQRDWNWCMGPRQTLPFHSEMSEHEKSLIKSQSLPQMTLANQPSMLAGNLGGASSATFHGLHTRKFGSGKMPHAPDLRMRGGRLAKDGWAGTFPTSDGLMYTGGPT